MGNNVWVLLEICTSYPAVKEFCKSLRFDKVAVNDLGGPIFETLCIVLVVIIICCVRVP